MAVFNPIVQPLPHFLLLAQVTHCCWIGSESVGYDFCWRSVPFQCLLHEGQSCLFIPPLRNVALQDFAFVIDGALEQQVLDVPQRRRVMDIYHHHQPDHLRGGVEIPKRTNGGLGHDPSFTEPRVALTAPFPALSSTLRRQVAPLGFRPEPYGRAEPSPGLTNVGGGFDHCAPPCPVPAIGPGTFLRLAGRSPTSRFVSRACPVSSRPTLYRPRYGPS